MSIGKNMMIISVKWHGIESFKLMPVTETCPYIEAIYDPQGKFLLVISKESKETLHMVPRLSESGDNMPKSGSKDEVRKQRIAIATYQEYYLEDKNDILQFIELFTMDGQLKEPYISKYLSEAGTVPA